MVGYFLRTTVVLTLALLAAVAARRRSAALRHFILSFALVGLLLLPVLSLVPFGWRTTLLPAGAAAGGPSAVPETSRPGPVRIAGPGVLSSEGDSPAESDGSRRTDPVRGIGARSADRRRGPTPRSPMAAAATRPAGPAATAGRTGRTLEARLGPLVNGPLAPRAPHPAFPARRRPGRGRQTDRGGNAARRPGLARPPRALPHARLAPAPGPPEKPSRGHGAPDLGLAEARGALPGRRRRLDRGRTLLGPLPRALAHQAGGFPGHAARPDEPGPLLVEPALLGRLPRAPQGAGDRLRRAGPSRRDQAVGLRGQPAGLPALGRVALESVDGPARDAGPVVVPGAPGIHPQTKDRFNGGQDENQDHAGCHSRRGRGPRRHGPSDSRGGPERSRDGPVRNGPSRPGRSRRRHPGNGRRPGKDEGAGKGQGRRKG